MDKNWDNNNNTCVSVLCVSKTVSKIPISNYTQHVSGSTISSSFVEVEWRIKL